MYIDIIQRGKSCDIKNKLNFSELKKEKNKIFKKLNVNKNIEKECEKEHIDISQKQKALKEALDINNEVNLIFKFI